MLPSSCNVYPACQPACPTPLGAPHTVGFVEAWNPRPATATNPRIVNPCTYIYKLADLSRSLSFALSEYTSHVILCTSSLRYRFNLKYQGVILKFVDPEPKTRFMDNELAVRLIGWTQCVGLLKKSTKVASSRSPQHLCA